MEVLALIVKVKYLRKLMSAAPEAPKALPSEFLVFTLLENSAFEFCMKGRERPAFMPSP